MVVNKTQMNKTVIFKIVFISIVFIQLLIIHAVPLMHMMNDSAWYYMNVHFVNTGDYMNESRYPSFHEPSQYYPFLGYSFFLFLSGKIAFLFHINVAIIIKYGQFLMYLASAILVRKTIQLITRRMALAYIISIVLLLYYPYFNYVNLVMSEAYATFLILLTIYLFVKNYFHLNGITASVLFLLAGYVILVKPVFLPASLLIVILSIVNFLQNRKYIMLISISTILIFPFAQCLFSKVYYDNYKLQTGLGWHLWDRVIYHDKQIPYSSESWKNLEGIYEQHHWPVSKDFWWNVTKDLSEFGYTEAETQHICGTIAMAGIASNPLRYMTNTLVLCHSNFLQENLYANVFPSLSEYYHEMENFSEEQQHRPLTIELLKQKDSTSRPFWNSLIAFNFSIARLSNSAYFFFHNSVIFFFYVLAGIQALYLLLVRKFKKNVCEFLIWFSAFSIILGSNMAEFQQSRLILSAVVLVMMILSIKLNEWVNYLYSRTRK